MTTNPDFRSQLMPAFSPAQADAIVVVIAQSQEKLATKADVRDVRDAVDSLGIRADRLDGFCYEIEVEKHLYAFLGRVVRRCRVLTIDDRIDLIEQSLEHGLLTEDEADDLRRTDILARGKLDGELVYLAVEVSRTADSYDLERAARRAALLSKAGRKSIPLVACLESGKAAKAQAATLGVRLLVDSWLQDP